MRPRRCTPAAPLFTLAACLLALPPGCGSVPVDGIGPPPDFAISVTVSDRPKATASPNRPRALRPARYIVEPDGLLRASIGPGSLTSTFPPPMRHLSTSQVADLWALVDKAGYLQQDPSSQSADAETTTATVARPTALVYVAGANQRRTFQVPLESPPGVPTRALVDRLAELAWITEASDPLK